MTIQNASLLQFQLLQTKVQQHFLSSLGLSRTDTAASSAPTASPAAQDAGSNRNARRKLRRELHDRRVQIQPEDLTKPVVIPAGGAYSSCESAGKIRNTILPRLIHWC